MKTKIFSLILLWALCYIIPFVLFGNPRTNGEAVASAQKTCYARIEVSSSGADFFGENDKSTSLFQIPNHYYVLASGVDGDFFKVTYKNEMSGFVRKSDVTLVEGMPELPFPSVPLSARNNCKLYDYANDSSNGLTLDNTRPLIYFGEKQGAGLQTDKYGSPISTWYYVRTEDFHYGYIYINDVSNIPNTDRAKDDPDLLLPQANQDFFVEPAATNFTGLSLGTQIMLIVAIAVPSLLILYFLIKPSKIMQAAKSKTKNPKKSKKHVSHGDYFEFDESEL